MNKNIRKRTRRHHVGAYGNSRKTISNNTKAMSKALKHLAAASMMSLGGAYNERT